MDIVTQGLLGSVAAVSGARKSEIKQAAWMGAVAGLLADADILIRSSADPLLVLEFHRQFSHSLIFIPIGALIAACFIWLVTRLCVETAPAFCRIYYFSFLGYMLSGLLDACTSYGTQLLWPFSDARIAWSLISIIDPIFTSILFLSLIIAIKIQFINSVRIGLGLCVLYLGFSYSQSRIAYDTVVEIADSRGHEIERIIIKPTFGNVVLWRTVYSYNGRYYIDAVNTLMDTTSFRGESVPVLDIETDLPQLDKASVQYQDVLRFNYFSNEFLATHPELTDVVGDVRYSIFPLSARSLWGIRLDPNTPESHIEYITIRESSDEQRKLFFEMLFGK